MLFSAYLPNFKKKTSYVFRFSVELHYLLMEITIDHWLFWQTLAIKQ